LQQPGIMGRCLVLLSVVSALAGCYNPPYPSQGPGAAEPLPPESSTPSDTTYRARRESAAGNGSSRTY